MIQSPLVSVIMPFLNARAFIEEAIASVLNQTYGRCELLLVDDGSTDGSTEIALRYAESFPSGVRYLAHENRANRGVSASRNLGGREANGIFIAYLDADDVWWPQTLEHLVGLLEAVPEAGMVLGATQYWCSWNGPEDESRDAIVPVGAPTGVLISPPRLLTLVYPLGKGASPHISALLLRREALAACGGWEDSFRRPFYDDQVFLSKLYCSVPGYVTKFCCDRYRQHPESSTATLRRLGLYHTLRYQYLLWLKGFVVEREMHEPALDKLLAAALRQYDHPWLLRMRSAPRGIAKWAAAKLLSPKSYDRLRLTLLRLRASRRYRLATRRPL